MHLNLYSMLSYVCSLLFSFSMFVHTCSVLVDEVLSFAILFQCLPNEFPSFCSRGCYPTVSGARMRAEIFSPMISAVEIQVGNFSPKVYAGKIQFVRTLNSGLKKSVACVLDQAFKQCRSWVNFLRLKKCDV